VRNHILARWRADVNKYLPEHEAASKFLPKHRHLASTAWQYLDQYGHINWGVAEAIMGRPAEPQAEVVVVVGAGLAGDGSCKSQRDEQATCTWLQSSDPCIISSSNFGRGS